MYFGRYATNEEIEKIFNLLNTETQYDKLLRYLLVFRRRELPRLSQAIIDLVFHSEPKLQDAGISALKNISNPSIRYTAIEIFSNLDSELALKSIELFINNYQIGDYRYIESVLKDFHDKDILHGACMNLIELFEKQPLKELVNMMLWVYENTPCAYCRNNAIRRLIEKNLLSEKHLNECIYDCVKDTRRIAKKALNY